MCLTLKDCPWGGTKKTRLMHSSKGELPAFRVKIQRLSVSAPEMLLRRCSHDVGGIWNCNNHRPFWICVWEKLEQGNHVIIVTQSLSKSSVFQPRSQGLFTGLGARLSVFKTFLSARERNVGIFKFPRFEEHFRKAPFSWQISVDSGSDRKNKAGYFNQNKALE